MGDEEGNDRAKGTKAECKAEVHAVHHVNEHVISQVFMDRDFGRGGKHAYDFTTCAKSLSYQVLRMYNA